MSEVEMPQTQVASPLASDGEGFARLQTQLDRGPLLSSPVGLEAGATFTGRLVAEVPGAGLSAMITRLAFGVGLSTLFGLSIGLQQGGSSLLSHAIGVPAGLFLVTLVSLPSLMIALALLDSQVSEQALLDAFTSSVATTGLVLAGLAPAVAFFGVTSTGRWQAVIIAAVGLALAGLLGLRKLLRAVDVHLLRVNADQPGKTRAACILFGAFAAVFAARVWLSTLPVFGGAA